MTTKIDENNLSTITNTLVSWQSVITADGSTSTNVEAGKGYIIDTSSAAHTINLPVSATQGDTIIIKDYSASFATNGLTINRNGHNIQGETTDSFINTNRASLTLVYVDSTRGWLFSNESNVGDLQSYIVATGGTITTSGDYKIHTFTGDGCFVVSQAGSGGTGNSVDYLVIAGGGSGGGNSSGNASAGGGGGAGGYIECSLTVTSTTYAITVGAGGAGTAGAGNNGSNSVFSSVTSAGGGKGGGYNVKNGTSGGSGGGGGARQVCEVVIGGTGNTPPVSPPQGNSGGDGNSTSTQPNMAGGGGGGATAVGVDATNAVGGNGGNGTSSSITGSSVTRAGGGGGGAYGGTAGSGGTGGGGAGSNSTVATAGTANTGGGGGGYGMGSGCRVGANGGKGIVIIRYKYQ